MTAGCGTGDLVVPGDKPKAPYDGPLDDDAAPAGAAGKALECRWGRDSGGNAVDAWPNDDGGDTPEDGLAWWFEIEQPGLPESGYRVEAERDGRVLFSYDVDGRTKIAVVVAKDQPKRPGWGPQSTAACDPAEFRTDWLEEQDFEVWTNREGERVPLSRISSGPGAEHCSWEDAHTLGWGRGRDEKVFVRDPKGVFEAEHVSAPYDGDATMPGDARDTGLRRGDWALWLTPEEDIAYVRTPDGVEAWPILTARCA